MAAGGPIDERNTDADVADSSSLERLLKPRAITIIGASPNSSSSRRLVSNIQRSGFTGKINLVNPSHAEIDGLAAYPDVGRIPGPLGTIVLLTGAEASIQSLGSVSERPDGVVVYGAINDDTLAAISAKTEGACVIGPQSTGFFSARSSLLCTTTPIPEPAVPGGLALLSQSGALLATVLRALWRRRVGVTTGISYGTARLTSLTELASDLLRSRAVTSLGIYAEQVPRPRDLLDLGRLGSAERKRIVLLPGAQTHLGELAARSHTAALATPVALTKGVCEQAGIEFASNLDEFLFWCSFPVVSTPPASESARGLFVLTLSGGGATLVANSVDQCGVPLANISADTAQELERICGAAGILNPLDAGARLLGDPESFGDLVRAICRDPAVGAVLCVTSLGFPPPSASHAAICEAFAQEVRSAGKQPMFATLAFDESGPWRFWNGIPVIQGSSCFRVIMDAIGLDTGNAARDQSAASHYQSAASSEALSSTIGFARWEIVREILSVLPARWPGTTVIESEEGIDAVPVKFPVVLKTEGLDHRARAGGVITGIRAANELRPAVEYLRHRFRDRMLICEQVDYQKEFIVGAQRRQDGEIAVLFGLGGVNVTKDTVAVRVAPMSYAEIRDFVRRHADAELGQEELAAMAKLIETLCAVMDADSELVTVDLNPVVFSAASLQPFVLDAKLRRSTESYYAQSASVPVPSSNSKRA
jgi:acetate---CoA ligase (ADP-forming)